MWSGQYLDSISRQLSDRMNYRVLNSENQKSVASYIGWPVSLGELQWLLEICLIIEIIDVLHYHPRKRSHKMKDCFIVFLTKATAVYCTEVGECN